VQASIAAVRDGSVELKQVLKQLESSRKSIIKKTSEMVAVENNIKKLTDNLKLLETNMAKCEDEVAKG
jgi:flagellin-like hook-associated protein FlgL